MRETEAVENVADDRRVKLARAERENKSESDFHSAINHFAG
jgi:hypothetical protein